MKRPTGFSDDFLDGWDCAPLTSARDLSERERGVLYPAWHANELRVWERDLRYLGDGECYRLRRYTVQRMGHCSFEIYDRGGASCCQIVSTTYAKALARLLAAVMELEAA